MVVNPLRQAQVIATALAAGGVAFVRDEALAPHLEGRRVTGVVCQRGSHMADHLVVCAGAWSARLLKKIGYQVPLEAQRGYHLTLTTAASICAGQWLLPTARFLRRLWKPACGLRVPSSLEDWTALRHSNGPGFWFWESTGS